MSIEDITPFRPIVLRARYNGFTEKHLSAARDLISRVVWNAGDESGPTAKSSIAVPIQPHQHPAFRDFFTWYERIAEQVIEGHLGMNKTYEYRVVRSWVNQHQKGDQTLEHHHGDSVLAMAAYLSVPNNSGCIEFRDPLDLARSQVINDDSVVRKGWFRVPVQSGDVVMFPGWLVHRTEVSESQWPRLVMSANIQCPRF